MLLLLPLLASAAQDLAANDQALEPIDLPKITVEASKTPRDANELAAQVTVIDSERMARELVQNIDDLVRYEPGIDVTNQGSRFGRAGFSIRGLDGNRVLIEVDGVPVSDAFSIGSFSNASRDFVDTDSLKQVEIVRGPSSALFGSDAIGGVVSFVTKDPIDYLGDRDGYLSAKTGYFDINDGTLLAATGAARAGDLSGMLNVTYREGSEREFEEPLDDDSLNVLGKLARNELGDGPITFTFGHLDVSSVTDVTSLRRTQDFSNAFGFPFIVNTTSVIGDDERERTRFSLDQEWSGGVGFTDYLRWRVYHQDSETRQDTTEERTNNVAGRITPIMRQRQFRYEQKLTGAELNGSNVYDGGNIKHEVSWGAEYEQADTSQLRDGIETNLLTGETTNVVTPDVFPVRDFPLSETDTIGIYLQDRISFGSITVIPALRWDRYKLSPTPDPIFVEDNPGIDVASLDEDEFSPKLGLLWDINANWQLFGQYAEGFRAPPVNDVNIGFTNLRFGYTALPNPDLKSEKSKGYEAGVRYRSERLQWSASAYKSKFQDFIQSLAPQGFDPVLGLLVIQSINIEGVDIEGFEFSGRWAPEAFPEGLSMRFAGSYTKGTERLTGLPVNSIAPPNGVLGLDYDAPSTRWGGSLILRGAEKQDRLNESEGPVISPDGYVALDALAYWRPNDSLRVRAGLFNITDEDYTNYLDVAGIAADTPNQERYRAPGFNYSVVLDVFF
ncbi:MAG: TonB-dependent hemoglobin/transferrin/lactoferrin family receptor [Xanthomonadales bacterium]|nr:TonB-dependent hemoglobin/transferrin/lactoferrin family receptor [Xanthomonadales bacterium]